MKARRGKIGRLPLAIREELNRRLLENEPGGKILPWLNSLPETAAVIAEMGRAGGHEVGPLDANNLSDWRQDGFEEWLRRKEALAETRELAAWSMKLAKASGGNLSEGAAAILSGQLLEIMEGLSALRQDFNAPAGGPGEPEPNKAERMETLAKTVDSVSKALASVRAGDHSKEKLRQNEQRLAQGAAGLKLEREKFEVLASRQMLDEALRRRAEEIARSGLSNDEKIAAMRRAAFADVDALEQSGAVELPKI